MKTWLLRLGQLVLTVLVTWFIFERMGLSLSALGRLDSSAWVPDIPRLAASSLLLVAGYGFSAALWGRLVVDLGGPRLGAADSIRLFMIANLGRYVPGKVWQIAGLAVLARRKGVPAVTATGAAVLGQGIALMAATAVGLGALLGGSATMHRWGLIGAGLLVVGVALATVPSVFDRAAGLWFRLARQEPPPGLRSVHALQWFLLYFLNWLLYALAFGVLVASFGQGGNLLAMGSAFAAAYVVGYVAIFAPAGAGVRELTLVGLLAPSMGAASAGALAVIARIWTTVVELVPAAAFWVRHVTTGRRQPAGGGGTIGGE